LSLLLKFVVLEISFDKKALITITKPVSQSHTPVAEMKPLPRLTNTSEAIILPEHCCNTFVAEQISANNAPHYNLFRKKN